MRIRSLVSSVVVALCLVGPGVGVGVAEDKDWHTLGAVRATPMNMQEMSVVTGKVAEVGSLFDFVMRNGQAFMVGEGTVLFWASEPTAAVNVSGPFGSAVLVFGLSPS